MRQNDTLPSSLWQSHEPSGLSHIRNMMYGQMIHLGIPCICSLFADARRCSIPCTPCIGSVYAGARRCSIPRIPSIHSFGAVARRCSIPCIPCIGSLSAGAGRCSIPHTPCIRFLRGGADRCSIPHTPCIRSLCAGARRCSIPRIPCICSLRAGAGRCSQVIDLLHSLHVLFSRRWAHILPIPCCSFLLSFGRSSAAASPTCVSIPGDSR